jgi:uncharacterized protein YggE
MKTIVRTFALAIAVSGLAASAVAAHSGKTQTLATAQHITFSHQAVVSAMPDPMCLPKCGIQDGN